MLEKIIQEATSLVEEHTDPVYKYVCSRKWDIRALNSCSYIILSGNHQWQQSNHKQLD